MSSSNNFGVQGAKSFGPFRVVAIEDLEIVYPRLIKIPFHGISASVI